MIISIRGTNGSGKSTIVRTILDEYSTLTRLRVAGRRQPIGYAANHPGRRTLLVPGHYETPCGGCDTISSMDRIFEIVRSGHDNGMHVLYEGMLISGDTIRTIQLAKECPPYYVIGLTTPYQACLDSINERRWRKNPDRPGVKEKNIKSKYAAVQSSMKVLTANGLNAEWHDRAGALERVRELLQEAG